MKTHLLTALLFGAIWTPAQSPDMEALHQDIRVISNMLETVFDRDDNRRNPLYHHDVDVRGTYLRDQGIVLYIDSDSPFSHFGFEMPDIEFVFPEAVMPVLGAEDMEETWELYEEAMEELQDVYMEVDEISRDRDNPASLRDAMRALREEHKQAMSEQRSITRDLRRQLERSREMTDEERQAVAAKIKASQNELKSMSDQYSNQLKELRDKQQMEWQEKQTNFERDIINALCDYGSALRSLPNDQFLTLIFDDGARSADGNERDRIYVFTKSDLLACRDGRIDKQTLMQKGAAYAF